MNSKEWHNRRIAAVYDRAKKEFADHSEIAVGPLCTVHRRGFFGIGRDNLSKFRIKNIHNDYKLTIDIAYSERRADMQKAAFKMFVRIGTIKENLAWIPAPTITKFFASFSWALRIVDGITNSLN